MPKIIYKNISAATVHVNKLAQPRNRTLMETFNQNCRRFSIFQIETIANKIYCKQFSTPQQAINEMRQKLFDQKKHVRHQKNEIKKLQKKIEKCNEFNVLASTLTKRLRDYMIKEQNVDVCTENEKLAVSTLDHLSKMFKNPKCDKSSSDVVDKVLLEFSSKFASFMCSVLESGEQPSTVHSTNDCLEKLKKLCLPIEDYNHVVVKEENESGSEEEDGSDDDYSYHTPTEAMGEIEDQGRKSFLTQSKVNITSKECLNLTNKLLKIKNDIDSGAIKPTASKKGDTNVPFDDNENSEELKIKKKKKPKKKKGKKKNEKCFGKRNIKPQWEIEWRDKTEGTCNKE